MVSRPSLVPNTSNLPLSLARRVPFSPLTASSEPPYVLDILSLSTSYAASSSDGSIRFFDKATLKAAHEIPPKRDAKKTGRDDFDRVTHIATGASGAAGSQADMLIVSYAGGSVGVFDTRCQTNAPQVNLRGSNAAPCLCAAPSSSNTYLASGTELFQHEATIRIHDLRSSSKPLHIYADAHSDDVSTLSFHPSLDHLLLSGSVDGLTSTVDVRIADEDDAILHTANVGASLSRAGWMSLPGKEPWQGTFALTNMETLSIYDASDEMSLVREFGDLRDIDHPSWKTDYVIDCYGTGTGLALFAGQQEGGLAIIKAPLEGDWSLEQVLSSSEGHSDIVRGCKLDLAQGQVASCGEDGMVCLWSVQQQDPQAYLVDAPSSSAGNERDRSSRFAPY